MRKAKNEIPFFPVDKDFFSDRDLRRARSKFGAASTLVYLYVLCEAYKQGYYVEYDDDLILDISSDLGIAENETRQIINYFVGKSLLECIRTDTVKVLTATYIQEQFQKVMKGRKRGTVQVNPSYWLLEKSETDSCIKVYPCDDNSEKKDDNSEKKDDNSGIYQHKRIEENRIEDSKVSVSVQARGTHNNVNLSDEDYQAFVDEYGKAAIDEYIDKISDYVENSGKRPYKNHAATLKNWLTKDGIKKLSEQPIQMHSYNLDAILERSLQDIR